MGVISDAYDSEVAAGHLKPDPAQETALSEFDRIALALSEHPASKTFGGFFSKKAEPIKGLYIWGGVGRGKSMLMDLFHQSLPDINSKRIHFHAFMQDVHSAMHEVRKTGVDDAIKPVALDLAKDLQLLCLDEMQITDITDAMIVGRLFEWLVGEDVVVVTTSNRPPGDLYKDGLNRDLFLPFIDFLNTHLQVHELASPTDYRQNRLQGAQSYFVPADATARSALGKIWGDLSRGKSDRLILSVKGRDVVLPAFSNGVAKASFYDLCGQPLGPGDYLAIADAIRLLILEDIPRLSSENYNQARRFVTLIDALYEAKVRLIASAADQPERLYIEGAGSFEFERTASRLREMQAADWGKT